MHDLIVAGGGPVGIATALHAARAGLDVVVLEPRAGDIDKACGEGLMPGAVRDLRELGVELHGRRLAGIRYVDGRAAAEARFRNGGGMGVRRTVLHAAMRAALDDAGVRVEHRAVQTVTPAPGLVDVDGIATRYLVGADGLLSSVRRLVGLEARPAKVRRFGLRCHAELEPWTDHVEVHWSRSAEAYVTPVADDLVGVAVLGDDRRTFAETIRDFPALAERLSQGPVSRVRGAGPLRQRSLARVSGRVLLVGDAAGYVDALTGEGIALGLGHARAAVAAVLDDDPARYESDWRRVSRRHDLLTRGLLAATRLPPVRRHLVTAARALPVAFETAVGQAARPVGRPARRTSARAVVR